VVRRYPEFDFSAATESGRPRSKEGCTIPILAANWSLPPIIDTGCEGTQVRQIIDRMVLRRSFGYLPDMALLTFSGSAAIPAFRSTMHWLGWITASAIF
jgi:hypothetical protein